MKIEKVETFFVSRFLVVKVTTEDGIEGIGESCYWSYPKAAEATIHGFRDELIGMDADNIEHIWSYLWSCLLYTSPSPRDQRGSRMPSSA